MLTFVLDASAVLRFVDNEAGADRVRTILLESVEGGSTVEISPVNWGEVIYILATRPNSQAAFALELAQDSRDHVLVAADFYFRSAEKDVKIEFLPAKNRP